MTIDPNKLTWIKSPTSDGKGGECIEMADVDGTTVAIRESERPDQIITTDRTKLRRMVEGARMGAFDSLL